MYQFVVYNEALSFKDLFDTNQYQEILDHQDNLLDYLIGEDCDYLLNAKENYYVAFSKYGHVIFTSDDIHDDDHDKEVLIDFFENLDSFKYAKEDSDLLKDHTYEIHLYTPYGYHVYFR